jgi:replicative DNA helicase
MQEPNVSIPEIRSKIKTILFEQNQLGLVIIDYLQLLQGSNWKSINRVQELSKITRDLKGLAREFNIPIIALSQLSRNADSRIDQRPILSDLRESGSIEQDADLILMLYSSKLTPTSNSIVSNKLTITELIIAKQRNGPIGTIKLELNKDRIQFLESNVID